MQTMSDDGKSPGKAAGHAAEDGRTEKPGKVSEVRRAVEAALRSGIVDQEKLSQIAEQVWITLVRERRAGFTNRDWRKAILDRCADALKRAEGKLSANCSVDKLFVAKIERLHVAFGQQVELAMQTVSRKYEVK